MAYCFVVQAEHCFELHASVFKDLDEMGLVDDMGFCMVGIFPTVDSLTMVLNKVKR